jgi:flagellar L-ring protein precursor FlgH
MRARAVSGIVLALALLSAPAAADTLYQAGMPPVGPGHPLSLFGDHRAAQIGDLLFVVFNFSVTSASSDVVQDTKGYNVGLAPGVGNAALGFLRFPTQIGGQTGLQKNHTKTGTNAFTSAMEAQVVDVLPSGVLKIEGNQALIINGQEQTLHVVGYVRPQDIDANDSVPSNRIANVQATFVGNFQGAHRGLLQKIVDFLF